MVVVGSNMLQTVAVAAAVLVEEPGIVVVVAAAAVPSTAEVVAAGIVAEVPQMVGPLSDASCFKYSCYLT